MLAKCHFLWPYLGLGAKHGRNKGTLLSSTFKVQENKAPLAFSILAHILILKSRIQNMAIFQPTSQN